MPVSVALATLGCKVNQAETEELRQQLEARGYLVTDDAGKAQVRVVNTCTVTHVADRKSRNLVQRACRANPRARVLVTGCYAERAPAELQSSPQVQVVPKGTAEELVRHLEESKVEGRESSPHEGFRVQGSGSRHGSPGPLLLNRQPTRGSLPSTLDSRPSPRRTRALVKAQDGCDQHCTYCAVPLARGRSRSLPAGDVLRRVEEAASSGRREVVLTGVNLTYYGREWGGSLEELLDQVLAVAPDRLRVSSLQPEAITESLLYRWRDRRLCRHFHLALQSGSDSVLRRMGRRYTTAQYREAVERIRQAVPGASITTDVMVGFPGETQREFEESFAFCRDMGFARMHVFEYSPRPGTAAARIPESVPARNKSARSQLMLDLAATASGTFNQGFLGCTLEVLFEEEVREFPGHWRGLTDNYLEVEVQSVLPLSNRLLPVTLLHARTSSIRGCIEKHARN